MRVVRRSVLAALALTCATLTGCTIYIPAGNWLPANNLPRQPQPILRPAPVVPMVPGQSIQPQAAAPSTSTGTGARATPGEMSGLLGAR